MAQIPPRGVARSYLRNYHGRTTDAPVKQPWLEQAESTMALQDDGVTVDYAETGDLEGYSQEVESQQLGEVASELLLLQNIYLRDETPEPNIYFEGIDPPSAPAPTSIRGAVRTTAKVTPPWRGGASIYPVSKHSHNMSPKLYRRRSRGGRGPRTRQIKAWRPWGKHQR